MIVIRLNQGRTLKRVFPSSQGKPTYTISIILAIIV